MRIVLAALVGVALWAGAASAEVVKRPVGGPVSAAMDRLEAAVTGAGATVFARVDHGGGAVKAGLDLAPAELLIFGNPQLGTPAMQADMLAGLYLPLKVLIFEDSEGQVWAAYEPPTDTFDGLNIDPTAGFVAKMTGALEKFSGAAGG